MASERRWSSVFGRWLYPGDPCICVQERRFDCPTHGQLPPVDGTRVPVKIGPNQIFLTVHRDGALHLSDLAEMGQQFGFRDGLRLYGIPEQDIDRYQDLLAE